ncbi:ABC transporter permease [Actinomadura rudentiformis]|uniref:ABC transporter permease n=1 Tax=Actinomadura rudentiformis TaxID=359158 RepID=A0A6H9YT31_9ACTN|nr:ABC transporter permease [Actinomadura rudentiformis]KAB2345171.1 ABC transporter permease [Actinomadura rudentiformis]
MKAVWQAAQFAVRRRKLQTSIIALVLLLSTATVVLALGLLVTVDGPYDKAFAQQHGAHLMVSYDPAKATAAQVAASASRPGVTAAGGPYRSQIVNVPETGGTEPGMLPPGPLTVTERTGRGDDPVDRLTLKSGRWATAPGEIVLGSGYARFPFDPTGRKVTFSGGHTFTIVGIGRSITRSAEAWVAPGQLSAPDGLQMLYRLADPAAPAGTITAGLPAASSQSYLASRQQATEAGKVAIPFLVAFGIAGLVVAVLIIGNVVSGAVVSGFRHIGVLKALGFSPTQVTGVYLVMVTAPGVLGSLAGLVIGNVLAGVVTTTLGDSYDLPTASGVSVWVDVLAFAGVLAVVVFTALVPAVRAGRIPAAVAVSAGAAPGRGRALRVQRALARTRLPRPVSLGLGLPFARPGRTAMTISAVAFGVAAVTFAAGLDRSLNSYLADAELTETVHVVVPIDDRRPISLEGRPGTAKVALTRFDQVHVPGFDRAVHMKAYQGDIGDRHGHRMVHGRWLAAPGEAVVGDPFLKTSGKKIGDTVVVTKDGRKATLRIVGTALVDGGDSVLTDWASLNSLGDRKTTPAAPASAGPRTGMVTSFLEVTLTPGTSPKDYVAALKADGVEADTAAEGIEPGQVIVLGLIALLTLGLAAVAALGVFNTVILNTRDRARDFGVLKSLGATPRQVLTVVLASMAALGLAGGLIGLPLGVVAHHLVMPAMADTGGIVLPYGLMEIFPWPLMVLSVLAGIAIALLGALIPAGRAARIRTAAVLHSE